MPHSPTHTQGLLRFSTEYALCTPITVKATPVRKTSGIAVAYLHVCLGGVQVTQ